VRFRVLIDGQPPGAGHGIDVDEQGNGTVSEQRLYQLIRQPKPIADRQFEIEFLIQAWRLCVHVRLIGRRQSACTEAQTIKRDPMPRPPVRHSGDGFQLQRRAGRHLDLEVGGDVRCNPRGVQRIATEIQKLSSIPS
jgi:hypothetical protein